MSIIGFYIRLSDEDLQRALADSVFARQTLDARAATSYNDAEPALAMSVNKAWQGIFHVLAAAGLPEDMIYGEELVPAEQFQPPPPFYFHQAKVAVLAEWFAQRPFADLVASADPHQARAANLYSVGAWDEADREFVSSYGEKLARFFASAAVAKDAIVLEVSY